MARPVHSVQKESSLRSNLVIYLIFIFINAFAFFTRADQALMMTVPTMFVMFNERLVNQAMLFFTLVSVSFLLSTLNTDTLCVLAAHTFLYASITWVCTFGARVNLSTTRGLFPPRIQIRTK